MSIQIVDVDNIDIFPSNSFKRFDITVLWGILSYMRMRATNVCMLVMKELKIKYMIFARSRNHLIK